MERRFLSLLGAFCVAPLLHCGAAGTPEPATSEPSAERKAGTELPGGNLSGDGGGIARPLGSDGGADASLPPMVMPSFLVGYNEGWFGPNYGSDLTTNYDRARVVATLDGIVRAGGRVVRLWLFEAFQGLLMNPTSPQIYGLDPALLTNLAEVLDLVRARGLWVYLTALDGNGMPAEAGPQRDFYWNLLNDKYGEAQAFQDKALAPLLAMLGTKRDVIYGFDLLNEIEAPIFRSLFSDPYLAPRAFIQRTAAFVKSKAPWIKVTSTAGWDTAAGEIAAGFFSGLGLDFYDLHVYSDTGTILAESQVCARAASDGVPIILGEFGQLSHVIDDSLQSNATRAFLTRAKNSCFKGALAWRFDSAEVWWDFVRDDGSFRPAVDVMKQFSGP